MVEDESARGSWISASGGLFGVEAVRVKNHTVCLRSYIPIRGDDIIHVSVPVFRDFVAAVKKGGLQPKKEGSLCVVPIDPDKEAPRVLKMLPGRWVEFATAIIAGTFDPLIAGIRPITDR